MEALDLQAGDSDGNDALEDELEVDQGPHGDLLVEGDLHLDGDGLAVGGEDGEGGDLGNVDSAWRGAALWGGAVNNITALSNSNKSSRRYSTTPYNM